MTLIGPRPQLVRDMVFMSEEQRMRHTATAQSCSASIGDIMNLRRNVEHNQFLATTRYLDIKDYVEYNKQTFVWQNTVSRAAYGNKHREEEGNTAFSIYS